MNISYTKYSFLENLLKNLDRFEKQRLYQLLGVHTGMRKRTIKLASLLEGIFDGTIQSRKDAELILDISSQTVNQLLNELIEKTYEAMVDYEVINVNGRLPENQKRVIQTKKKLIILKILIRKNLFGEAYFLAKKIKDFCEKYELYYDLIEVLELIEFLRVPLELSDEDLGYDGYQELERVNKLSSFMKLSRVLFFKTIQNPFTSPKKAQYKDKIVKLLDKFHQFGDFSFSRNLTAHYLFLEIELSLIEQQPEKTLKKTKTLLEFRLKHANFFFKQNIATSYIYFGLSNLINFKNEEALAAFLDAKKLLSRKSPNYTIGSIYEALAHFRLGNYRFVLNIYENYKDKELYFQKTLLLFLQVSSLFMLGKYVEVLDFIDYHFTELKRDIPTRYSIQILKLQCLVELKEFSEATRILENLRKFVTRYPDEIKERQKIIYSILEKFLKYGVFHQRFLAYEAREIIQLVKEMSEQILHGSEIITFDYWLVQKLPENWRKNHLPNIQEQLESRYNIQTVLALLGT